MNRPQATNQTAGDPGAALDRRLRRLWRDRTALLTLRGLCWLLAAASVLVLVDLLLDWLLDLPGSLRVGLAVLNLALLGYLLHARLWRHLARYDDSALALRVERAWPDLKGLLISCVQFRHEQSAPPGVSVALMKSAGRQAAIRAETIDFRGLRRVSHMSRMATLAALAVLALGLAAAWRPEFFVVFAGRMIDPMSDAAYPTRTSIEVLSGDVVVRFSKPVTLEARAGGEIPGQGQLFLRLGGGRWESVALAAEDGAAFRYVLPRATQDSEYYFHLGDAVSPRHRVHVERPPQLVEGRVHLGYPPYTHLQPQEVATLNVKVPEGTRLAWRLHLDRPVQSAELRVEGDEPVSMHLSADGCEAAAQLPAEASRSYLVTLHWKLQDRVYTEISPKHYVQVVPDSDPRVGMLRPAEDVQATLKKTVTISYWAEDDYGLADATIIYSINDGGELRYPLGRLEGCSVQREFHWPITEQLKGLREGDIVTLAIEVHDGRPATPGVGRSMSRRIQFVSPSDYLAYCLAKQRKLLGQLRPLFGQEREAAEMLQSVQPTAAMKGSAR